MAIRAMSRCFGSRSIWIHVQYELNHYHAEKCAYLDATSLHIFSVVTGVHPVFTHLHLCFVMVVNACPNYDTVLPNNAVILYRQRFWIHQRHYAIVVIDTVLNDLDGVDSKCV